MACFVQRKLWGERSECLKPLPTPTTCSSTLTKSSFKCCVLKREVQPLPWEGSALAACGCSVWSQRPPVPPSCTPGSGCWNDTGLGKSLHTAVEGSLPPEETVSWENPVGSHISALVKPGKWPLGDKLLQHYLININQQLIIMQRVIVHKMHQACIQTLSYNNSFKYSNQLFEMRVIIVLLTFWLQLFTYSILQPECGKARINTQ